MQHVANSFAVNEDELSKKHWLCQIMLLLSFSCFLFFFTSFLKPLWGLTRILLFPPVSNLIRTGGSVKPWHLKGFCEADAHRLWIDNDTLINSNPFWLTGPIYSRSDWFGQDVPAGESQLGADLEKTVKGSASTMDEGSPPFFSPFLLPIYISLSPLLDTTALHW